MSTRSILALQKGNKVRYCFLHWDGDNHGQTLKEMLDSEIEELFNAMAPIEDGDYVYLDHLHSKSYWDSYIEANRTDWVNRKGNKSMADFEKIYCRPQPSAYLPVVISGKKAKEANPDFELDPSEVGAYTTKRKAPKTVNEALNGHTEFMGCEYVWFYNLDTRVITCFTDHHKWNWKPHQMPRRKRLTPKKFDFSDWFK